MTETPPVVLKVTDPGFVFIDKPTGWTSHDVVARVRRVLGTRKVGHAGTLDPLATGLLIVGVNRATRLLGYVSGADKHYESTILLGVATHSDDADGELVSQTDASHVKVEAVEHVLEAMVGEIDQVPSAVSAIKVDGKRAHARVRAGEDFELPSRRVTIHSLEVLSFVPGSLGVGGHVLELRRTFIGAHSVEAAQPLAEFGEQPRLLPPEFLTRQTFEGIDLSEAEANDVLFGRPLAERAFSSAKFGAVYAPDGSFLAVYENAADGIKPVSVFV